MAQDDGGIYVLTRDPLKFVFRIDSTGAESAQFSPDSRQIVFFTSSLLVEIWDIDRQEQSSVVDVPAVRGCRQTELSPDAKYLACFGNDFTLALHDVASGEAIFRKENFYNFDAGFSGYDGILKLLYFIIHPEVVTLRFSPDARYFAASSRTREEIVIDLVTQKKNRQPHFRERFFRGWRAAFRSHQRPSRIYPGRRRQYDGRQFFQKLAFKS